MNKEPVNLNNRFEILALALFAQRIAFQIGCPACFHSQTFTFTTNERIRLVNLASVSALSSC
ncbi:hypothetical protein T4B_501 [Trichinella pseudospiralis]|uniref:Uncharacterized protein n=1 Tax=Trichinella pseudospiralis TaxID=6337 RepID=A0A0V1IZF8_TRIPS|nr:hypothetical protein T4B_501 [Trichinella pseudospiralis]